MSDTLDLCFSLCSCKSPSCISCFSSWLSRDPSKLGMGDLGQIFANITCWLQGMKAMAYPPSSLGAAVKTVFLNNTSKLTTSNQHARLALLQYLLLDLGVPLTPSTFRYELGPLVHSVCLADHSLTPSTATLRLTVAPPQPS